MNSLTANRPARILVAEDEELVLALFKSILGKAGHNVVGVADGAQAAALFDDAQNAFDLLITDLSLPGLNGEALAARAREARPEIKVIFSTGNITQAPQKAVERCKGAVFLPKPFAFEELVTIVHSTLQI
jgi:DNA-binding response OmpR family regulator